MVNLTIDNKQVTVSKDATIYEAAKAAGINIPILCHDKKLRPFGGCRMCLVEVEQMKGRLIPACTTPVTEGMIVTTMTDDIVKARKLVLELLLLNHPVDCPVCDKAGDCDLQNLTYDYEVDRNHFQDEKFHHQIDYENPLIERDMNRCVLCGKCARICDEIVSYGAYTFINRGIETKMGTEFDGPLSCEFCGSCVSVCPVGALLARPFKFKARWWSLNKVKTVCSYCGTGCNMTLGVKDNKVLTTVYDENQGFHNGQLCVRGRFGYQFTGSEKRLTTPLVRKNGELVAATWDEALSVVADKLKESGAAATAALVTPRLTNEELLLIKKLFKNVIGTDNIDHAAGYAHSALTEGAAESLGRAASPSTFADIQKSGMLLVVKTDTYETHPVVGFEINLAVKNKGVDLRIVSDKRGKLSRLPKAQTTVHLPGAETVLLNALAKVIVDDNLAAASIASIPGLDELKKSLEAYAPEKAAGLCGVDAATIKKLAADYAAAEKALIILPLGQGYPGHDKALAQAAINLALLTNKIGGEGNGVLIMGEKNNSQGAVDLGIYPTSGGKNAAAILEGAASGTIKTLFIAGENPVVSYPNRKRVEGALDKVEFLVVQDLFLTETAAYADVVLPACSFAEKEGTFTSAERKVQRVRKAIAPVGQSRSDFDILSALYQKLAGEKPFANVTEAFFEVAASVPGYQGLTLNGLGDAGVVWHFEAKPAFKAAAGQAPAAQAGKLALLTGSVLYHSGTLSLYGKGPMHVCPEGYVELSRTDATKQGVQEGDAVTIKSPTGEIRLKAKVGRRLPEGVVFVPYHFAEASANSLTDGAAVTWVTVSK